MIAVLLALMLQAEAVETDPIADLISATTEARETDAPEMDAQEPEVTPDVVNRYGVEITDELQEAVLASWSAYSHTQATEFGQNNSLRHTRVRRWFFDPWCHGNQIEGGLLVCRAAPGTVVQIGDRTILAARNGLAVHGLERSSPESIELSFVLPTGEVLGRQMMTIAQRDYDIQRVEGVPQRTVTPDPSTLQRRQREYAQKQTAFNSLWDGQGFLDGFIAPATGITTGVYGSQRVYNGTPRSPHWGHDYANDIGTPVSAPASGRVTLAEADMYYEGGLIFIDHGQGLVSAFLHMSAVHVSEGDIVEQGQLIGEIGAGGRATGPHLDWRVKLRNGFYVDPALLLELDLSGYETGE